jgi:lysozyme family protein
MAYPTPKECLAGAIERWEGLWQASSADSGNYAHCQDGGTKLIGTMRGVTPDVYARYKGIEPCSLTAEEMETDITLAVAADIGVKLFYVDPGFSRLTWSPLVEIAVDIGWCSGPVRAIKMLQHVVGAIVDGILGPQTAHALDAYLEAHDVGHACDSLTEARVQFYIEISPPGSSNARFRGGWLRRANWYRTSNASWWNPWEGWTMSIPANSSKPVGLMSRSSPSLPVG